MRTRLLLLPTALMLSPLIAAPAERDATSAVGLAQSVYVSAESARVRVNTDGDALEESGPMRVWSGSLSCRKTELLAKFMVELNDRLVAFCASHGGRMNGNRCWRNKEGVTASWFAHTWKPLECNGSSQTIQYLVYEIDPVRHADPGADAEWARVGQETDQQIRAQRDKVVANAAAARAAKAEEERARAAAERAWIASEAPRKKIKGTQICKQDTHNPFLDEKNQVVFRGYVEEVSGDRIKVLVTGRYWGAPGSGNRDPNYRGQEYTWSNVDEWYLC